MVSSPAVFVLGIITVAAVAGLLYAIAQLARVNRESEVRVRRQVDAWMRRELTTARSQIENAVRTELRSQFERQLQSDLQSWRERELAQMRLALEDIAYQEANVAFEQWKADHETAMRADAVQRSYAVTRGKIIEQLVPYLPEFDFNPKDARFIGTPIDFIVFDGLGEDRCDRVVFVEVKTGSSTLTSKERKVRDAVFEGRVAWHELRLPDPQVEEMAGT